MMAFMYLYYYFLSGSLLSLAVHPAKLYDITDKVSDATAV